MTERTIFLAAIEISDPAERAGYVAQACDGDTNLRTQVEQLLRHHEESSQFLEKPAGASSSDVEMTIVGHGASDEDDDQSSAALSGEAELRKYLQPATRPGWLGRLAHYEIEQTLGRGAFGIVVKAFDEKLHRVVAIKLMNPDLASTSPPRKRFLREARTAAAVRNEYIVGIHAVEEEPLPYLVMEYVPGMTLQQQLDQDGPLELSEILRIGQQVASGLAAAHAANLIHRDIKPSNILLEGGVDNRAKISDFGLARAVDDASLTSSGLIAGTPMYMAPEQARGEVLDHRADLFSLGSVLYQMASGRPPFRALNTVAVLKRVCEDAPRPIEDVIPGTADWLCSIIMRLLEKTPADRFQTAKEVADLFARCQAELQLNGKVTCVPGSRIRENSDFPQPASPLSNTPPNTTEQASSRRSEKAALNLPSILYGIMLGMMVLLPILFGKQVSSYVDAWIWPAIPALPPIADSGGLEVRGLEFDGKDDFVSIDAVDWSYPQFTIEAFVTSARDSDNGTIVYLGGGGEKLEWMSLYDDHPADPGKRLSGAAIKGKTPFANTSAPFTAGVRQHRVLVFDGRYMHYYVNGIWQAKRFAEAHEGLMWKMKNLRIACDDSEQRFFQGRIDQVRISRIALYDANFAPVASLTSDDSTLALYKFDEGAGDVLKDASGNGHDGRIVGAKWVKSKSEDLTSRSDSPAPDISYSKSQISNADAWDGWPADAPAPAVAPFSADQARQHQEAWAKYLNVPVEYTNPIGMKFRLVPPGEFMRGSSPEEIAQALGSAGDDKLWQETIHSEGPRHKVLLTKATYVGVHEVTQGQFEHIMGRNPSRFGPTGASKDVIVDLDTSRFPVEKVSWDEATRFCVQLSQVQDPTDDVAYRLLTDAEWEFCCRAGTTTELWIGENHQERLQTAWTYENSGDRTHAVGELKENPFGLYDVHGNVWEWVQDGWDPAFYSQLQGHLAVDPIKPSVAGAPHVTKGGCWSSSVASCRSATRCPETAAYSGTLIGFRVSLAVEAVRLSLAEVR